jgi:hypothetical protein
LKDTEKREHPIKTATILHHTYPYNDFKSELSKKSQIQLEEQYEAAILDNEMVVFVRDTEKKEFVSYSLEY